MTKNGHSNLPFPEEQLFVTSDRIYIRQSKFDTPVTMSLHSVVHFVELNFVFHGGSVWKVKGSFKWGADVIETEIVLCNSVNDYNTWKSKKKRRFDVFNVLRGLEWSLLVYFKEHIEFTHRV